MKPSANPGPVPLPEVLVDLDDPDPVEWWVKGHHRPKVAIAAVRAHLQELIEKGERDTIPPLGGVRIMYVRMIALDSPDEPVLAVTLVCDLEAL